ncbi:ABC transporter ATPase [uncultured Tenacibaculum sp.]|uniref:ABC transporter ATPase n=1 Tax=uncultured Tenacibaculum sp. TaxID=174713 RepID=UPI00263910F2|nr:ABC transporter ATPase [uncultured Tenacibaculum sp.]
MIVPFKDLSEEAKIWIYPSSRKFYPQEVEPIKNKIEDFLNSWIADKEAEVAFTLLYNRFIVFSVEEGVVISNQDLDKQVMFILELQKEYEIELLDKMNVCFKQGEFVQYKEVKEFKKLLKNKSVNSKTVVFDNLVQTKYDFDNFWEVPITESWYNRFL